MRVKKEVLIAMKEIKKILFPVDFSEVSPKICSWVLGICEKFDAEIHVLFVARQFEYFASMHVNTGSIERFEKEILEGAEIMMKEFVEGYLKGHYAYRTKVVLGDAAEEILSYVESQGVDMVVMGTHGRKGLEKIFFGSVAERVIKNSPVPVMSVNPYRAL